MKRMKTSLYGYHKPSVRALLKQFYSEHVQKKQSLVNEWNEIQADVEKLENSIRSRREGGRAT